MFKIQQITSSIYLVLMGYWILWYVAWRVKYDACLGGKALNMLKKKNIHKKQCNNMLHVPEIFIHVNKH